MAGMWWGGGPKMKQCYTVSGWERISEVQAAKWCRSEDPYRFYLLREFDDCEALASPLMHASMDEVCEALQRPDDATRALLQSKEAATVLLYRVAAETDDAESVRRLLDAGADPRGGTPGAPGQYFRLYCYHYLLPEPCRAAMHAAAGRGAAALLRAANGKGSDREQQANDHAAALATFSVELEGGGEARWHVLARCFHGADAAETFQVQCEPLLEPLHCAVEGSKLGVVAALLAAGARGDAAPWSSASSAAKLRGSSLAPSSPLAAAAAARNHSCVRRLLAAPCAGQACGSRDLLALLLRTCGADPDIYAALLRLALPRGQPAAWLASAGPGREVQQLVQRAVRRSSDGSGLRQVLVYESHGGFEAERLLLLMAYPAARDPRQLGLLLDHVLGPAAGDHRAAARGEAAQEAAQRRGGGGDGVAHIVALALTNWALCQRDGAAVRALVARGVGAQTEDLLGVRLLPAALRGECAADVVATLLEMGADPNACAGTADDDAVAELRRSDPALEQEWTRRCWVTITPPLDVALRMLQRAMAGAIQPAALDSSSLGAATRRQWPVFWVDADGRVPRRPLRLLATVEALVTAGGQQASLSAGAIVNELLATLQQSWDDFRADMRTPSGDAATAYPEVTAAQPTLVARLLARLLAFSPSAPAAGPASSPTAAGGDGRQADGAGPGSCAAAGQAAAFEQLSISRSLPRQAPGGEGWHQCAARYLRLVLVIGEGLAWTPAMHLLFPGRFKAAVQVLLLARGGARRRRHSGGAAGGSAHAGGQHCDGADESRSEGGTAMQAGGEEGGMANGMEAEAQHGPAGRHQVGLSDLPDAALLRIITHMARPVTGWLDAV